MQLKIKKLNIDFDEANHTYTRRSDGKLLTGVTTILSVRNKEFLTWWSVKMMYEDLIGRHDEVKKATKKEYEKILLEAKKAHTKKKQSAADLGKIAHSWIEQYIKNKKCEKPEDERVANMARAFLKWEKKNKVKWLASELMVASDKHDYAGTIDGLAIVNGKLTLVDFKSSNQISEDYALQTAGYQIALEEMGITPEQRIILRLGKDQPEFEAWTVNTPLDFDKETFLNCRNIHRWNVLIKNNYKVDNKLKTN